MDSEVILGVAAAALAAACFDGGVILQAADARREPREHGLRPSLIGRLLKRRRWVAGTLLAAAGLPLQLAALSLAPVTVVQPTLALGMLLLLAAGAKLLGEPVVSRHWAAAVAVIAGVGLIALTAQERSDVRPPAGTLLPAIAVMLAVVAAPFVAGNRRSGAPLLIAAAGTAFALSSVFAKLLVDAYSGGALVLAGALVPAALISSAVGLLIDTTALQRFAATRVAPPVFVLETAIPVALAPLLFGESWPAGWAAVGLAAGLVLVLGGGAVLGRSRAVSGFESGGELEHGVGGAAPR